MIPFWDSKWTCIWRGMIRFATAAVYGIEDRVTDKEEWQVLPSSRNEMTERKLGPRVPLRAGTVEADAAVRIGMPAVERCYPAWTPASEQVGSSQEALWGFAHSCWSSHGSCWPNPMRARGLNFLALLQPMALDMVVKRSTSHYLGIL